MRTQARSYEALITPMETILQILNCQDNDTTEYESTLQDELYKIHDRGIPWSMLLFKLPNNEIYVVVAAKVAIGTTNTVSNAVKVIDKFIKSGEREISLLYNTSEKESGDHMESTLTSILVTLSKYKSKPLNHYGLLPSQLDRIPAVQTFISKSSPNQHLHQTRTMARRYCIYYAIMGAVITLFILSITVSYLTKNHRADELHSWIQYNTRGSTGPKYQLHVDASNASAWSTYAQDPSLWYLRIDDQAIIPIHLLDDEERHYQDWIQKRYPEMNQIRVNRSYVDETWLSSPAIDEVPTDELFHFSHCVLAVKRYIKAKDTGKHVCGRDIDKEHVHHCLSALDWWAFPEGRMGEDIPNVNRTFWWRTKACFD